MAKSAERPTASKPCLSAWPSACAACVVTPISASVTVRRNSVHAMFSINSNEVIGDVPGLQSVASAIGIW